MMRNFAMRVFPLDSSLEPVFWEYVNRDVPCYYHFIVDLKHDSSSTKIWLAFDEQEKLSGLMMVYRNAIATLRGSSDAVKLLLEKLDLEKAEIQVPIEYKDLVIKRFKKIGYSTDLILMVLRKGEEKVQITHPLMRPTAEYAEEIADLMRSGDPDWWGDVSAERIAKRLDNWLCLGVKDDGKLVSFAAATLDEVGGIIAPVVTSEEYRNRGYATSIVSALVERILQKTELALLFAEKSNPAAVRVYSKVGFKPYKEFFAARVAQ